jgi:hypothetical protein
MNIFFLHWSPRKAAEYHCDKHVVKMILETAQLLYAAHWLAETPNMPENAYKLTHKNHPCSVWVRKSLSNYLWLCSLGWWLCKEYQYRYGRLKEHKTESHIKWLLHNPPKYESIEFTIPPQAMPDEFKRRNTIRGYRKFYIESKMKQRGIVSYTRRSVPYFIVNET